LIVLITLKGLNPKPYCKLLPVILNCRIVVLIQLVHPHATCNPSMWRVTWVCKNALMRVILRCRCTCDLVLVQAIMNLYDHHDRHLSSFTTGTGTGTYFTKLTTFGTSVGNTSTNFDHGPIHGGCQVACMREGAPDLLEKRGPSSYTRNSFDAKPRLNKSQVTPSRNSFDAKPRLNKPQATPSRPRKPPGTTMFHFWCPVPVPVQVWTTGNTQTYRETCRGYRTWNPHVSRSSRALRIWVT